MHCTSGESDYYQKPALRTPLELCVPYGVSHTLLDIACCWVSRTLLGIGAPHRDAEQHLDDGGQTRGGHGPRAAEGRVRHGPWGAHEERPRATDHGQSKARRGSHHGGHTTGPRGWGLGHSRARCGTHPHLPRIARMERPATTSCPGKGAEAMACLRHPRPESRNRSRRERDDCHGVAL